MISCYRKVFSKLLQGETMYSVFPCSSFIEIMKFPLQSLPILRESVLLKFSLFHNLSPHIHTHGAFLIIRNQVWQSAMKTLWVLMSEWFVNCNFSGITCSIFVNIRSVPTLPAAWSQNEIEANQNIQRSRFQKFDTQIWLDCCIQTKLSFSYFLHKMY